ncbi:MAG: hypothetical protein V3S15_05665 [Woeseiaceae bacterium]
MSEKKVLKPVALAVGAALVSSFALGGIAAADTTDSPFAMSSLSVGYMLGAGEGSCGGDKEGKGDEGSCGGDKKGEGSCGGDKEGEASCGGDKDGEGSCGGDKDAEGSCGGDKDAEGSCGDDKDAEGKCGEGSCGGSV